jgi:type I restriction enzyme M protein
MSDYVVVEDMREIVDITELNQKIAKIVVRQNELRTAIDEIVKSIEWE